MSLKFKTIAPLLTSITLLIVNFYLINNKYFKVHDWTGGARIYELHQTLKDGHFPPRWSKNHGFGYGMPLFEFYSPLPFFVAEIFMVLGFSILSSLKLTYFSISIIGFFGAYQLGKKLNNKWGGMLSAIAFTLSTYHAVNIYVRGALAEILAISLMPWTVHFALQLNDHKVKKYYLGLTISLALLFLSHNVTLLTFMPFWALIVSYFIFFKPDKKKIGKSISAIALSGLTAFLISSFFLIPAFLQKKYTRVDSLTGGFSQYPQHFLYFRQLFIPNWDYGGSIGGPDDDMSFYIGNEMLLIILFTGISLIIQFIKENKKKNKKKSLINFTFLSTCFLISVFLTNFKSQIIWDKLPLVSFIQFPWRYLGVATFLLSILISYSFQIVKNKSTLLFILSILIMIFSGQHFKPEELMDLGQVYNPDSEYIQSTMSGVLPDYLPPNIDWEKYKPIQKPMEIIEGGQGTIDILIDKTQILKANVNLEKEAKVKVNRFIFPNWNFKIDNKKIYCEENEFVYRCLVPEGKHQLEVYWSEKGVNRVSNILSLIGIMFLIIVYKNFSKILKS